MSPPERSAERDAALSAMLAHVELLGWTRAAMRRGLSDIGADPVDAEILIPGGGADLVEAWLDLLDRQTESAMAERDLAGVGLGRRLRLAVELRLAAARPHRVAMRRAVSVLALPRHAGGAARSLARTVDALWNAAGDRSTDFAWYTKRAILGGIYAATVLFWLQDDSDDDAATLAFLDRRLADHARFHQAQRRCRDALTRWIPGEAAG
jgi:ubiquinone biosynthesis protein COQ9